MKRSSPLAAAAIASFVVIAAVASVLILREGSSATSGAVKHAGNILQAASAAPTPAISVPANCSGIPLSALQPDGTLDPKLAPQFHTQVIPNVSGGPGAALGCVPTAVDYPQLDKGAAQAKLVDLAKVPDARSLTVPVYSSSDGTLVGYNLPTGAYAPAQDALKQGAVPEGYGAAGPSPSLLTFTRP